MKCDCGGICEYAGQTEVIRWVTPGREVMDQADVYECQDCGRVFVMGFYWEDEGELWEPQDHETKQSPSPQLSEQQSTQTERG